MCYRMMPGLRSRLLGRVIMKLHPQISHDDRSMSDQTPALLLQSIATQNSHSTRTQHSHRRQDPLEMMAVHKFIAMEVFDDNPDLLEE